MIKHYTYVFFYANVEYAPGLVRSAMGTAMEAEQANSFK